MLITEFKKSHLLVDMSYLMHYRANATFAWYKNEFHGNLPYIESSCNEYNFVQDDEYMEHYYRNLLYQVKQIAVSTNCKINETILALDCKRSEIWRKDIYTEYKANRDVARDPKYPNLRPVFNETINYILPKIEEEMGFRSIKVDRAEADDVIAIVSKYLDKVKKENVVICANDMDISQLCNNNINMVTLSGDNIRQKMFEKFQTGERLVKHKALSGDRGDNIPSVKYRKMGDKTAMKCLDNEEMLTEFFENNPDSLVKFELHNKLVDFKHIPLDIQGKILKQYLNIEKEREHSK